MEEDETIETFRGLYNGTHIITDDGVEIPARAYASQDTLWKDKKGFFNVKTIEGWDWGIIMQALIEEENIIWTSWIYLLSF